MNAPTRRTVTACARPRGGIVVEIPGVELVSEANTRGLSIAKARRVADQRAAVESTLRTMGGDPPALPAVVCITRLAPMVLDTDNLQGACKAVRDAVATWLLPVEQVVRKGPLRGTRRIVGDDRDARITWRCAQEKSAEYGVRIEVAPARGYDLARPSARVEAVGCEEHVDVVLGPEALGALAQQIAGVIAGTRGEAAVRVGLVTMRVRRAGGNGR